MYQTYSHTPYFSNLCPLLQSLPETTWYIHCAGMVLAALKRKSNPKPTSKKWGLYYVLGKFRDRTGFWDSLMRKTKTKKYIGRKEDRKDK